MFSVQNQMFFLFWKNEMIMAIYRLWCRRLWKTVVMLLVFLETSFKCLGSIITAWTFEMVRLHDIMKSRREPLNACAVDQFDDHLIMISRRRNCHNQHDPVGQIRGSMAICLNAIWSGRLPCRGRCMGSKLLRFLLLSWPGGLQRFIHVFG